MKRFISSGVKLTRTVMDLGETFCQNPLFPKLKMCSLSYWTKQYTAYAGWAVTAIIAVKFGTALGRWRPEIGSGFPIESYGSRGVSRPSLICGTSQQKMITPTELLRPINNFYSLTICS